MNHNLPTGEHFFLFQNTIQLFEIWKRSKLNGRKELELRKRI